MKLLSCLLASVALTANMATAADFNGALTVEQAARIGNETEFRKHADASWSETEDGVYQSRSASGEVYQINFGESGKRAAVREIRQEIVTATQHLSSKRPKAVLAALRSITSNEAFLNDISERNAKAHTSVGNEMAGCRAIWAQSDFDVTVGMVDHGTVTASLHEGVDFGPSVPNLTPQYIRVEAAVIDSSTGLWAPNSVTKRYWTSGTVGPISKSAGPDWGCTMRSRFTSQGCGLYHQITRQATCSDIADGIAPSYSQVGGG